MCLWFGRNIDCCSRLYFRPVSEKEEMTGLIHTPVGIDDVGIFSLSLIINTTGGADIILEATALGITDNNRMKDFAGNTDRLQLFRDLEYVSFMQEQIVL